MLAQPASAHQLHADVPSTDAATRHDSANAGLSPSPSLGLTPSFQLGTAAHQRHLHVDLADGTAVDGAFPGILEPREGSAARDGLDAYLAAVRGELAAGGAPRTPLSALLRSHGGALHLCSTPLRTAEDFSRFLVALSQGQGWTPHADRGLMVLRRCLAPYVSTANEGPCTQPIGSHNEYGLSSHHPQYVVFFCVEAPAHGSGGQTPIASSLELYAQLKHEDAGFVRALERQGLAYSVHHPREKVEGSLAGNGLLEESAFGPTAEQLRSRGGGVGASVADLSEAEKRAIVEENVEALARKGGWSPALRSGDAPTWQRKGWTATWLPDASLLVTQRVPAVRPHPRFGRTPAFFNNLHNRLFYARSQGAVEPPHLSTTEKTKGGERLVQFPPYLVSEVGLGGGGKDSTEGSPQPGSSAPAADPLHPLHPLNDERLPARWEDLTNRVTARVQADVQWTRGDVLILDNVAVQHARRTWQGERKLLASLWDA